MRVAERTFTVHFQTPYVASSRFDLVVIPRYDSLRGDNVLVTRTALHRVTKAKSSLKQPKFLARP